MLLAHAVEVDHYLTVPVILIASKYSPSSVRLPIHRNKGLVGATECQVLQAAECQCFLRDVLQQRLSRQCMFRFYLCLVESQLLLQGTIGFYYFDVDSSSPPDLLQSSVFGNPSSGLLLLMLRSVCRRRWSAAVIWKVAKEGSGRSGCSLRLHSLCFSQVYLNQVQLCLQSDVFVTQLLQNRQMILLHLSAANSAVSTQWLFLQRPRLRCARFNKQSFSKFECENLCGLYRGAQLCLHNFDCGVRFCCNAAQHSSKVQCRGQCRGG